MLAYPASDIDPGREIKQGGGEETRRGELIKAPRRPTHLGYPVRNYDTLGFPTPTFPFIGRGGGTPKPYHRR